MNTKEKIIYDYLKANHIGKANAIHSKQIEERFGISSRTLRSYISSMRQEGIPICSNEKGYWIAENPDEVKKTVSRLGGFIGEVDNARTGLAFATIQMRSVTRVQEEHIEITVKVK